MHTLRPPVQEQTSSKSLPPQSSVLINPEVEIQTKSMTSVKETQKVVIIDTGGRDSADTTNVRMSVLKGGENSAYEGFNLSSTYEFDQNAPRRESATILVVSHKLFVQACTFFYTFKRAHLKLLFKMKTLFSREKVLHSSGFYYFYKTLPICL